MKQKIMNNISTIWTLPVDTINTTSDWDNNSDKINMDSITGLRTVPANGEDLIQLKSRPPPFQECIQPQAGFCVKNEVNVVLAL